MSTRILKCPFCKKTKINFKGRFQCSNLDIIETYWCNSCGYDFFVARKFTPVKREINDIKLSQESLREFGEFYTRKSMEGIIV